MRTFRSRILRYESNCIVRFRCTTDTENEDTFLFAVIFAERVSFVTIYRVLVESIIPDDGDESLDHEKATSEEQVRERSTRLRGETFADF